MRIRRLSEESSATEPMRSSRNLKVEFTWFGYMGVNDADGHLMVNKTYLNSGDKTDIYLDVVHELCHVKQHLDGKDLLTPLTTTLTDRLKWKHTATQRRKRVGLD